MIYLISLKASTQRPIQPSQGFCISDCPLKHSSNHHEPPPDSVSKFTTMTLATGNISQAWRAFSTLVFHLSPNLIKYGSYQHLQNTIWRSYRINILNQRFAYAWLGFPHCWYWGVIKLRLLSEKLVKYVLSAMLIQWSIGDQVMPPPWRLYGGNKAGPEIFRISYVWSITNFIISSTEKTSQSEVPKRCIEQVSILR